MKKIETAYVCLRYKTGGIVYPHIMGMDPETEIGRSVDVVATLLRRPLGTVFLVDVLRENRFRVKLKRVLRPIARTKKYVFEL